MTFYEPEEVSDVLSRPILGDDIRIHLFLLKHLGLTLYKWEHASKAGRQEIKDKVFDYIDFLISDPEELEDFTFALNCHHFAEGYRKAGSLSTFALAVRFLCTEEEEKMLKLYYLEKTSFCDIGKITHHDHHTVKQTIETAIARVTRALLPKSQC